jgi:hypothetical protein
MASQAKKVPLKSEVDLAIAVTAPLALKERLLRAAIRESRSKKYGFSDKDLTWSSAGA